MRLNASHLSTHRDSAALSVTPMDAAVRARALTVSKLGAYMGLFDFWCYAMMTQQLIFVWFYTDVVDIVGYFSPTVRSTWTGSQGKINIVATRFTDGLTELVTDSFQTNHWIAASACDPGGGSHHDVVMIDGDGGKTAEELRHAKVPTGDFAHLSDIYAPFGLCLHETVCQGDCGAKQTRHLWARYAETLRAQLRMRVGG